MTTNNTHNYRRRPLTIWGVAAALVAGVVLVAGLIAMGAVGAYLYDTMPPIVWIVLVLAMVGTAGAVGYITGRER